MVNQMHEIKILDLLELVLKMKDELDMVVVMDEEDHQSDLHLQRDLLHQSDLHLQLHDLDKKVVDEVEEPHGNI